MRLNYGEDNGVSLARRTSQSSDRIVLNVIVCRTFLRSVFTVITRVGALSPASHR
jgi:hypothetical protein